MKSTIYNQSALTGDSHSVQVLFQLIRIALGKEEPSSLPNDINWQEVYDLSLKQGVGAIACDGMLALKDCDIDEELRYKWMGQSMVIEQNSLHRWGVLCQIADLFAQRGIKTYVLKGFSYASLYPKPFHRPSSDLDICLLGDFEKGNQIIEGLGVSVNKSESKHSHFTFNGVHVENHQFCIGVKGSRTDKEMDSFLKSLLGRECSAFNANVLKPNWLFNAFFFMCHARTHFLIEEGLTLKNVCDWIVLKDSAVEDAEIESFKSKCEEFELLKFERAIDEVAEFVKGGKALSSIGCRMLEDILSVRPHKHYENKKMAHLNILRMIWKNRWKYSLYSETTPFRITVKYLYGFLFERDISQYNLNEC